VWRTHLHNDVEVEVTPPLPTAQYDFFEYYLPMADNSLDVEVTVTAVAGTANVYVSKDERYPSPLRAVGAYGGYWSGHTAGADSAAADPSAVIMCTVETQEERLLYIAVESTAAHPDNVGSVYTTAQTQATHGADPLRGERFGELTYRIRAKVFRYRVESELLDPNGASVTVRVRPGRLSALSVSHSKSALYGAFVWTRRALNRQKRRFPARAGAAAVLRRDRGQHELLRGGDRARPQCRFVPPIIPFIPDLRTYSVPLLLKLQCDRTLGGDTAERGLADGQGRQVLRGREGLPQRAQAPDAGPRDRAHGGVPQRRRGVGHGGRGDVHDGEKHNYTGFRGFT
jgi:hypothetical protein